MGSKNNRFPVFCVAVFLVVLVISAINPKDYFTWFLEIFPALIALVLLAFTYKSFRLTDLAYGLILLHSIILMVGGHYTYAEVPLGDWAKEWFGMQRNNYDKVGHFAQGFIPALIIREVLIRKHVVSTKGWRNFIIVCVCLAISAVYEFIEWFVAEASGENAEAFLGTQGYVWDTQSDMLCATIGAIAALVLLSKWHNAQLKRFI
jgi:putative membrane protein